jgi:hypothetical protein
MLSKNLFRVAVAFHILYAFNSPIIASEGMDSDSKQDPFQNIRYDVAFNQNDLYEKYPELMERLGCEQNVGIESKERLEEQPTRKGYTALPLQKEEIKSQIKDFQQQAVALLEKERRFTVFRPAYDSMIMISLLWGGTAATILHLGNDSMGGSFAFYGAMTSTVFALKPITKAAINYFWPPRSPLDFLEIEYAENRPFIPSQVWPMIEEKFMSARQNPFVQSDSLNFLRFVLRLTYFEPKPMLELNINDSSPRFKALCQEIDKFFENYDDFNTEKDCMPAYLLKGNIIAFLECIITNPSSTDYKNIFFTGPGGIGKTEFAKRLTTEWIPKIFPNANILFATKIITSTEELEGSAEKPGMILDIIADLCSKKSTGAVVILDETNWINEREFNAPCKRIFDPKAKTVEAPYLGKVNGKGVPLRKPPLLSILAGNEETKDEALKSRFVSIKFPGPKKSALKEYAFSLLTKKMNVSKLMENQVAELEEFFKAKNPRSFRDVEEIPLILTTKWEFG